MKIYTPYLHGFLTAPGLIASCERLGVEITDEASPYITHVLPLADYHAAECVRQAEARRLPYLSADIQHAISDKSLMTEMSAARGIPTLRTAIPKTPEDILEFPFPAILKKRRTYTKAGNIGAAYRVFENPAAMLAELNAVFWAYQDRPDPTTGEYVIQQAVADQPKVVWSVHFAVNANSDAMFARPAKNLFDEQAEIREVSFSQEETPIDPILPRLQEAIRANGIKCALMSCQFIMWEGNPYLIDWNFRPGSFFFNVSAIERAPVFDTFMAHLLGIEVKQVVPKDAMLMRRFTGLNESRIQKARRCELKPLSPEDRTLEVKFLYATGRDLQTLRSRFEAFEEELAYELA